MKKLFFSALPFLIYACNEKTSNNENAYGLVQNHSSTYSIEVTDTIIVDSGNEMIFMDNKKSRTDFSDDGKWYYNYNRKEHSIEVINLEEAKLEKKLPLEKEGPNGTGPIEIMDFNATDLLFVGNEKGLKVFNSNLKMVNNLKKEDLDLKVDPLIFSSTLSKFGELSDDGQCFYSIFYKEYGLPTGIAKIDFKNKSFTNKPLGIDAIKDYRIKFKDGALSPELYFNRYGKNILISNQVINELFVYDLEMEASNHFTYKSDIIKDKRTKPSKNEAHSKEEFDNIRKSKPMDAFFGPMQFDPVREQYYRLSIGASKNGNKAHKVLTVFDKKFNQVFETDRINFKGNLLNNYFVRDGKIYIIENFKDEMAFVVMEVKEI